MNTHILFSCLTIFCCRIIDVSQVPLIDAVANPTETDGGGDIEDDDSYRERIREAENKLMELERGKEGSLGDGPRYGAIHAETDRAAESSTRYGVSDDGGQMSFFMTSQDAGIIEKIRGLDIMNVTPGQAIDILRELKDELNR